MSISCHLAFYLAELFHSVEFFRFGSKPKSSKLFHELWTVFAEMIEILDDSHTFVFQPEGNEVYFSRSADAVAARDEFSLYGFK